MFLHLTNLPLSTFVRFFSSCFFVVLRTTHLSARNANLTEVCMIGASLSSEKQKQKTLTDTT